LAIALAFGARLLLLVGDGAALDERTTQLIAISAEQSFAYWRALGTIYRGWAKVDRGDVENGLILLRSGSADYCATGAAAWTPFHLGLLAKACAHAEQIEEAATLLDEALQTVERTGERWFEAELHRYKGELLHRKGRYRDAEALYREAMSIADEQGAELWKLRTAVSHARLLGKHGRRSEARDLLTPVYGWFTEGFGIPDLQNAKRLLDEVR